MLRGSLDKQYGFIRLATICCASLLLVGSFSGWAATLTFDPVQNLSANPGGSDFGGSMFRQQLAASGLKSKQYLSP